MSDIETPPTERDAQADPRPRNNRAWFGYDCFHLILCRAILLLMTDARKRERNELVSKTSNDGEPRSRTQRSA